MYANCNNWQTRIHMPLLTISILVTDVGDSLCQYHRWPFLSLASCTNTSKHHQHYFHNFTEVDWCGLVTNSAQSGCSLQHYFKSYFKFILEVPNVESLPFFSWFKLWSLADWDLKWTGITWQIMWWDGWILEWLESRDRKEFINDSLRNKNKCIT